MGIVEMKEAINIAIASLKRDYKYWLLVSDSAVSGDAIRGKIAAAIAVLEKEVGDG